MARRSIIILAITLMAMLAFGGAALAQSSKPRKARKPVATNGKTRYANQETSYRKRRSKSVVQYNSTDWDFRHRRSRKKRRPVRKPRTTNLLPYMEQTNRNRR